MIQQDSGLWNTGLLVHNLHSMQSPMNLVSYMVSIDETFDLKFIATRFSHVWWNLFFSTMIE